MTEVQLLDKTEVWVRGARVSGADLPAIGRAAAEVLSLPPDRVFVTDIGADHICFDILIPRLRLGDFAGKQPALLGALRAIPGVSLSPEASVHSEGILGLIGAAPELIPEILSTAARMDEGLRAYISRRLAVVSTGSELMDGRVIDTNLEAVRACFGAAGYEVESGGVVPDDRQAIAGRVARLVNEDYGLVITTGGVGAEAKDHTIEALELLDPTTATAVLAKFEAGHGRHVKNAIRIGIAQVGQARVVALPGPTHEVLLALPILLDNLERDTPRSELVERLAVPLRAVLSETHHHHRNTAPPRRIGLFGGTFDPVHNGHLSLARHALHALSLAQVIFIPSGTPPSPEKTRTITDAALRVEMLRAAISGDPAFSVSTFETESSEKSYTINTLRHMAREYPPPAELFFLMGTDTAAKLERWIDLDEMRQLSRFVAVPRSGQMPANVPAWVTVLETPALAWSSSDLRERARSAQSIANVTPPAVVELIHRNGLYRHA